MTFNIENLSRYVAEDNYTAVWNVIQGQKKQEFDYVIPWKVQSLIYDGMRDAVCANKPEMVKCFLVAGMEASGNAHKNHHDGTQRQLTYFAAKVGNLPMVQLLHIRGAKAKDESLHPGTTLDNQDTLRAAIKGDHAAIVAYWLQNGGSANGQFKGKLLNKKFYFLTKAAFEGKKEIVALLVQYGANVYLALKECYAKFQSEAADINERIASLVENASTDQEKNCIHSSRAFSSLSQSLLASTQRYAATVRLLLDYALGIDLDRITPDDLGFLNNIDITGCNFIGVSQRGEPITREMLVAKGLQGADKAIVSLDDLEKIQDQERRAELKGRLQSKMQIEGQMISPNGIVNLVPLGTAVEYGKVDAARTRLLAGICPNQVVGRFSKNEAIVVAARAGYTEVVRLLAEHPQINTIERKKAMEEATRMGHTSLAEYLSSLEPPSDVNALDEKGQAPIHLANWVSYIKEVTALLERGAEINLKNASGETPLLSLTSISSGASKNDITYFSDMILFLLEHGADPKIVDKQNQTALHHIVAATNLTDIAGATERVMQMLLDNGADINAPGQGGFTPLHEAVFYGNETAVAFLVRKGANTEALNSAGRTPLKMLQRDNPKITALLTQSGASSNSAMQ